MFPLAERRRRRRQKFTLVLFLSFHPAVSPGMPSACHHTAQWHWANDVIISSHSSVGPLDPWACAEDTLVVMCGVQLWTWQNSLMPRCLRMPKCGKIRFKKVSWLTFTLLCCCPGVWFLTGLLERWDFKWQPRTKLSRNSLTLATSNRGINIQLRIYGWNRSTYGFENLTSALCNSHDLSLASQILNAQFFLSCKWRLVHADNLCTVLTSWKHLPCWWNMQGHFSFQFRRDVILLQLMGSGRQL